VGETITWPNPRKNNPPENHGWLQEGKTTEDLERRDRKIVSNHKIGNLKRESHAPIRCRGFFTKTCLRGWLKIPEHSGRERA